MNYYEKGKIEVNLNGEFLGCVSSVRINKNANKHNMTIVNLSINSGIIDPKTEKKISQKENYDNFFKKLAKAFKD